MIQQRHPPRPTAGTKGPRIALLLILVAGGVIALQWLLRLHPFLNSAGTLAPPAGETAPGWGLSGPELALVGPIALAAAFAHVLAWLPRRPWSQALALMLLGGFGLRYLHWRAASLEAADPVALGLGAVALGVEALYLGVVGFPFLASLGFDPGRRRRQADQLQSWARSEAPAVSVWILCRDEPLRLLRRAVLTCRNLDHPGFTITLIDPAARPEVAALALELGVSHLPGPTGAPTQPTGPGTEDAELIAVFDGTFLPFRSFLSRSLGFFRDPRVAMVQTPQKHFQSEFYNRNLGLDVVLPGDRDSFFHFQQVIRDRFNAVKGCDTSFVVRRSALVGEAPPAPGANAPAPHPPLAAVAALQEGPMGGRLLRAGWRIVYLDEILSVGEAPRSFSAYLGARLSAYQADWRTLLAGLGRSRRDPWQGAFLLDDGLALLIPLLRVALFVIPLLALIFAVPLIAAPLIDYVAYGLPFLLLLASVPGWLSDYHFLPFWSGVYESLFAFPAIARLPGLLRHPDRGPSPPPAGEPEPFRQSLELPLALPFLLLLGVLLLTLVGRYVLPMLPGSTPGTDGSFAGEDLLLLWNLANGGLLLVCLLCCIDQPVRRNGDRLPLERPALLRLAGSSTAGHTRDLSESGAALVLDASAVPPTELGGAEGWLDLPGASLSLPVQVARVGAEGPRTLAGLRFGALDPETDRRLLRLLYGGAVPPPQPRRVEGLTALRSLLGSLWRAEPILRRY